MLAAGAVAVALALILVYGRAEVLDADRFADRAAEAVTRPAVNQAIAEAVTRDVIERARPDALAARPLVQSVVANVIGSDAFRPVVRAAARQTYRVLGEPGGTDLVLGLTDAAILAIEALRQLNPRLAAQLPDEAEQAAIDLGAAGWTSDLVAHAATLRALAPLSAVLAVALLAGGVALARDRRHAAATAGLATAAGGLLALAAVRVGGWEIAGRVRPDHRDAAAATWEVFTDPLRTWAVWAVAGGIAVWAIARDLLDAHRLVAGAHAAASWALATPDGRREAALRGIVLIAAGVALALLHDRVLAFALLLLGALVAARGVDMIVAALAHGPGTHGAGDAGPGRRLGRAALVSAAAVAVAALGATALLAVTGGGGGGPAGADGCNGRPELCDRRVTDVAFAATHNSMAAADEPGWFAAEQTGGIEAQLRFGIRGFLIDTWYGRRGPRGVATDYHRSGIDRDALVGTYGEPAVAALERLQGRLGFAPRGGRTSEVFLCHVACEGGATPLEEALRTMRRFLERNPGEVLILVVQDQVDPADARRAFVRSGLREYVLPERPRRRWPTLGQMVRRNERVIVLNENRTDPEIPWMLPAFEVMQETPFAFASPAAMTCAPGRGRTGKALFQLNHWVSQTIPSPRSAAVVNARSFLLSRARRCARERDAMPNLIAVDFYEEGDLLAVVDELNGVGGS